MMFLLSLLSIIVIGSAFLVFVSRKTGYIFSLPEFAGMSFLTGMAFAVFLMFFYSAIGLSFRSLNLAALPVFLFLVTFPGYMAKPQKIGEVISGGASPSEKDIAGKLLFWGITIQVLWILFLTLPYPAHSHDAVANYALKAKIFFLSSGIPSGFFSWGESTVAHTDYPLFLPFVMTWVYVFTGFNDVLVRLIMPLTYVGFLAVFFSLMKKLFDRSYAFLTVFILATIPQISDYASIIHADLILTAFVTTGALYLLLYARTGSLAELLLACFMMGSSVWIKNEGLVFTAVFCAVMVTLVLRTGQKDKKRVFRDVLRGLSLILAVAFPWLLTRSSLGTVNSDLDIKSLTAGRLMENIKEIPALLNLFQQEVFGPKKWNIFWVIFFAALVWKRQKLRQREIFYLSLFIGSSAMAYFAAYMCMTGENLYFYINTTISRFMLHFVGLSAILAGYLLYDDVKVKGRSQRFVFVDRDGVINRDGAGHTEFGYITRWKDFTFLPGVIEGFKDLTEGGYKSVVISNQQCVGKGIMTVPELETLTEKMRAAVREGGGSIEDVFYCTHTNQDNCSCRKPKDGLFIAARKKFGIKKFEGEYFIGDSERDIIAGKKAGLGTILVLSGKSSREDADRWEVKPDHICENFTDAVKVVMEAR